MAGNNVSVWIGQDGVYETELSDGCDDLIYLLFGMRPGNAGFRCSRDFYQVSEKSPVLARNCPAPLAGAPTI